ncbi:hypothetical protein CAEBREN_19208 [Caenorhabditis brenneri]|uniref:F-box domain-containing protein n=1 Tax=Caenorhabditis brenneri TaxID=135651 RepID=G0P1J8_CAEBE|nr:hypothetical protein CAEBREN_19208 [Caenorhabditis brenneri]
MTSKPMTLLSMEAILGKMDMEKLFELRRKSDYVKWVSDGIPINETRKWDIVEYIKIDEDKILADIDKTYVDFTPLNGTRQTRWAVPKILTIKNSSSEMIRKSIFPVSRTFCKNIESLDIYLAQNASEEYLNLLLQLIRRCPKIWTLCVHIPNLSEAQLFQFLDSYELELREKNRITLR